MTPEDGTSGRAAVLLDRVDRTIARLDEQALELVARMEAQPELVDSIHDVLKAHQAPLIVLKQVRRHLAAQVEAGT